MSSTGGAGGQGCDLNGNGFTGVDCDPNGIDCDDDNDGHDSVNCPEKGDDCDDEDANVYPNQPNNWYTVPDKKGNFDYDCSGKPEPEFAYEACTFGCKTMTNIFVQQVSCGDMGSFGDCTNDITTCNTSNLTVKTLRCH